MARFSVPQFIDIESKIVGPLTIKQFAFIAIPSLVTFLLFFVLNFAAWIIVAIVLVSSGIAFAFVKVGGRPLWVMLFKGITFFWEPKLFLWKQAIVEKKIDVPDIQRKRHDLDRIAKEVSRLGSLWRDMNTKKNPIPKREKKVPKRSLTEIQEQYQVIQKLSGEKAVARRIDYR